MDTTTDTQNIDKETVRQASRARPPREASISGLPMYGDRFPEDR